MAATAVIPVQAATGEDARPLSDIEGQIHRLRCGRRELAAGRLRLTGKAFSEPAQQWGSSPPVLSTHADLTIHMVHAR